MTLEIQVGSPIWHLFELDKTRIPRNSKYTIHAEVPSSPPCRPRLVNRERYECAFMPLVELGSILADDMPAVIRIFERKHLPEEWNSQDYVMHFWKALWDESLISEAVWRKGRSDLEVYYGMMSEIDEENSDEDGEGEEDEEEDAIAGAGRRPQRNDNGEDDNEEASSGSDGTQGLENEDTTREATSWYRRLFQLPERPRRPADQRPLVPKINRETTNK